MPKYHYTFLDESARVSAEVAGAFLENRKGWV
jgi:hypothetical protein